MSSLTAELDAFFPIPSGPPSAHSPARLPGITHASSQALVKMLKDNHVKWHAFFNDIGYHNHASHHLLAIYALGAGGPLIEAAYETHVAYMKPAFEAPEKINGDNFWKHVGKRDFYSSYLEYFRALLLKNGIDKVLEEYVFSSKANVGGSGIEGQPRMLNRFLATAVHPMIHTGCGLEFGILGLVAEGIAQTAVHPVQGANMVQLSFLQTDSHPSTLTRISGFLPSLTLRKRRSASDHAASTNENPTKTTSLHAFTVLARILADDRFSAAQLALPLPEGESKFDHTDKAVGQDIAALADQWSAELSADGATSSALAKKIEELAWMNVLIYGVPGWVTRHRSANQTFNADFFMMHYVTSSIFLPSIVAHLSLRSATALLRAYFSSSLGWWIAEGRPALPIREFYEGTSAAPVPPNPRDASEPGADPSRAAPAQGTLTPADAAPNAWLPLVQTTLVHPAEHLCKVQRMLLHDAVLYGARAAGELDFASTELAGAELLDGTLFVRVAGLTADRLGWMREGQEAGNWDRVGFY